MRFVITQIINETKNHTLYLACLFYRLHRTAIAPHNLDPGQRKMTLELRSRPKRVIQKLNKFLVRVTIKPPEILAIIDTSTLSRSLPCLDILKATYLDTEVGGSRTIQGQGTSISFD